jgi:solute carrier family 45 protein 1/2/4
VSFGRTSLSDGRPNADGQARVEFINDLSPLVIPTRMSSEVDPLLKEVVSPLGSDDDWQGEHHVEETKSSFYLFLLTLCGLGLQIGWSVETSNGSVSHHISQPQLLFCSQSSLPYSAKYSPNTTISLCHGNP